MQLSELACNAILRRDSVEHYRLQRADALMNVGASIWIMEPIFNTCLGCEFS